MKNTIKTELIYNFIKQNNLSKRQFSKLCKISPNTLNKIMSNCKNFNIVSLFKIARILKVQIYQMFE